MKNKRSVRKAAEGYALVAPLLAGCAVFYLLPFLKVVRNSAYHGIGYSERFVGLDNYTSMLGNSIFRLALWNTFRFLLLVIPVVLVISLGIALAVKRLSQKKYAWLKSVLLLPYTMPVVGTVMIVEILFAESGLLTELFRLLGLPAKAWLSSAYAFWIAAALYLWKNTGYAVILMLSGLVTIPEDQELAADLDGASVWQKLWFITLPQMRYSIFFTAVFSLINAFKCFREIFLIGGTHPHSSIYMLQHFINNAFHRMNYPKLASAAVLLFLVLTVLFVVGYDWVMRKEGDRE